MKSCPIYLIFFFIYFMLIHLSIAQTSFNISNQTTGDTLFTINNEGKVGIGTTTPGATIEAKSDAVENATSLSLSNSDDSHYLYLYSGRDGSPGLSPVMIWQEGDPMRFASWGAQYNEYMRLSAEGNLGIGTTTPSTKLEVADTIFSSFGGFMFPDSTVQETAATGGGNTLDEAYDQDGAGAGRTITADAGAVEINGSGGLHVSGVVDVSSGLYLNGSGVEGGQESLMDGDGQGGWIIDNYGSTDNESFRVFRGSGFNDIFNALVINSSGNVGIGTGGPSARLDAQMFGNGMWQRAIRVLNPDMVTNDGLLLVLGKTDDFKNMGHMNFRYHSDASDSNRLSFGLYGVNDVLNVLGSGNVGIGTTAPTEMLEVADTIYSSVGGFKFPDQTVQTTAATGGGGASSINDLTDGRAVGYSVFLGSGAGTNDDGSDNYNVALGTDALNLTTTGEKNIAVGSSALISNTEGNYNTAVGHWALYMNTTGEHNVGIGQAADIRNQGGSNNTMIGFAAGGGSSPHTKSGNVFIGYMSGAYETGDNKLYIENSDSNEPLIGGDFATDEVDLNGEVYVRDRFGVGTTSPAAGMHLVGNGYPNSFMYLESTTGGDAGFRLYEGTIDKWHIFNNASLDGLQIYNDVGVNVFFADQSSGNVGIGTTTPSSKLDVRGNVTVRDESSGDVVIELGTGLDYAEGFDVSDRTNIVPGTVLCIDENNPGNLKMSEYPYDFKVAGIVAGANELGSGVTLGSGQHDFNVALAGRVYCNVDASNEEVKAGDLLTTSEVPGFAQKVTDYQKSQGAILGKAMQNLEKGEKGQILVLVTLQ